jgi:hypothetical protein
VIKLSQTTFCAWIGKSPHTGLSATFTIFSPMGGPGLRKRCLEAVWQAMLRYSLGRMAKWISHAIPRPLPEVGSQELSRSKFSHILIYHTKSLKDGFKHTKYLQYCNICVCMHNVVRERDARWLYIVIGRCGIKYVTVC